MEITLRELAVAIAVDIVVVLNMRRAPFGAQTIRVTSGSQRFYPPIPEHLQNLKK